MVTTGSPRSARIPVAIHVSMGSPPLSPFMKHPHQPLAMSMCPSAVNRIGSQKCLVNWIATSKGSGRKTSTKLRQKNDSTKNLKEKIMHSKSIKAIGLIGFAAILQMGQVHAKPLKVFILCGQSNMEGHAQTITFPAVAKDPKTADLYQEMVDAEGKPVVCENVWISYAYGDFSGNPIGRKKGQLTTGWGSQHHVGSGKIGPEFTFGITMSNTLNEPILLIKNAWGGKSLMRDFRPPSAGELVEEEGKNAKKPQDPVGMFYGEMMEHVKEVLADPKSVYPGYDPKEGYELAGFVWFQGWNDAVAINYPVVNAKQRIKDYSEYSRLLACFIRDVRNDLSAPKMPFVTGVIGVNGEIAEKDKAGNGAGFRAAMAAPAEMAEFKGNVFNVFTAKFWPAELDPINDKKHAYYMEERALGKERKIGVMTGEDRKKAMRELRAEMRAKMEKEMSEEELFLLDHGMSNAGFHYYGSAKFHAQAGKAFAEALVK